MQPEPSDVVEVRGVNLRRDPAREPCFAIVRDQTEMLHLNDDGPVSQLEKLHSELNSEVQTLELAAQSIADFPGAPWELRLGLARQCWDEARHAGMCYRRLMAKGGTKGQFPVLNQEWAVVGMFDTIEARLAVQQRSFEGGSLDVFMKMVGWWRRVGDDATAEVMEAILIDEIAHVAFANEWIARLAADDKRVLLRVAAAMAAAKGMVAALTPKPGEPRPGRDHQPDVEVEIPANVDDRRRAGFSDRELAEIARRQE